MIKRYALYFAWLFSLMATLGSLYVSEILEYAPCPMCWYQRICVFPMAICLGTAAYRRFNPIALYFHAPCNHRDAFSCISNSATTSPFSSTLAPLRYWRGL